MSGEQTSVTAAADLTPRAGTSMSVRLTSFRPAAIAELPSSLAFLTDLDVPVSIKAAVELDGGFKPGQLRVAVHLGKGRVRIGRGDLPLRNGVITISGTTGEIVIEQGRLDLAHPSEGAPEIVDITGRISHASNRLAASLSVGLDSNRPRGSSALVAGGRRCRRAPMGYRACHWRDGDKRHCFAGYRS